MDDILSPLREKLPKAGAPPQAFGWTLVCVDFWEGQNGPWFCFLFICFVRFSKPICYRFALHSSWFVRSWPLPCRSMAIVLRCNKKVTGDWTEEMMLVVDVVAMYVGEFFRVWIRSM